MLTTAQHPSIPFNQGNLLITAGVSQVEHSFAEALSALVYSANSCSKSPNLLRLHMCQQQHHRHHRANQ